jgi:ATP-dependent DNA helicase RecG
MTRPIEASAPADDGAGTQPVSVLRGVGPNNALALERLGIRVLQDLWFHLPLRYEDRTRLTPIKELSVGRAAQVEGVVTGVERSFRFRPLLRVAIEDGSGATLTLRFFHFRSQQVEAFEPGARFRVFGEVRFGAQGLEIVHPEYKRLAFDAPLDAALTPVYPATEGLGQKTIVRLVRDALRMMPSSAVIDVIPDPVRKRLQLGDLRSALWKVHAPSADDDIAALVEGTHPAQRRLAIDELLAHQLSMRRLRRSIRLQPGARFVAKASRRDGLLAAVGFHLTAAQQRVVGEIDQDLTQSAPMLRLLQGDVGSGKTVVAALAALAAIDGGFQAVVMAPTEILAEQHLRSFSQWLLPLGVRVVWLAGKVQGKARDKALAEIAGDADLIVGTHALMQEAVNFRRLGLVVIDEQHRFGVHQRLALREKGVDGTTVPHQLVMTATPIPRTLAMAAYADLDTSVIDQLPPGRTPVQTVALKAARRDEVIERIRVGCSEGRQAYWVCPLIEESEQMEAQAAEATFDHLRAVLPELRIGLIHGRLRPKEKLAVMDAFKCGALNLLVATTVIEVGVDVPNASLMVIENAERMGLAQLHQLRGRVGRGSTQSTCVLLYQSLSELARERIRVMRETNDGFRIAEKDLELRGPGEMLGTRQTGVIGFRVADLSRHGGELPELRDAAEWLLEHAPAAADTLIARWIGAGARFAEA